MAAIHDIYNDDGPKYLAVEKEIKRIIEEDRLQPGMELKTEAELVERLGVSRITVRRALSSLEQNGLISRVRGKGTFLNRELDDYLDFNSPLLTNLIDVDPVVVPDLDQIVCVLPQLSADGSHLRQQGWFFLLTNVLAEECRKHNLMLNVMNSSSGATVVRHICESLKECNKFHGLIYWHNTVNATKKFCSIVKAVLGESYPYIVMSASEFFDHTDFNYVLIEEKLGIQMLVQHLYDLGHRRIAYIDGNLKFPESIATADLRRKAFLGAMANHGLRVSSKHYITVSAWTRSEGRKAATRLLNSNPRPTAIFSMSDICAFGVIEVITKSGLKVPDDITVAGSSDRPISRFIKPPLTCIRKPRYLFARNAVAILLGLRDGKLSAPVNRRLQSDIIIRASTGPVKAGK